jgi:hypothetical protein
MRGLLALLFLVIPARADRKIVIKQTIGGHSLLQTRYVKGNSVRLESNDSQTVQVFNRDNHSFLMINLRAEQYTLTRPESDPVVAFAAWLLRTPQVVQSGKKVDTYFEAIDTGESRQMFGQTARHWIQTERVVAEPGACTQSHRIERDGWYIAGRQEHELISYLNRGAQCQDTLTTHGTKQQLGLALLEEERISNPEFMRTKREVIEFSDQTLDQSLFEPPKNFTRVDDDLSWLQQLELAWDQIEQSITSWF